MKNSKKDMLEDFVWQHREEFDTEEPPVDMFSRISAELQKREEKKEVKIRPLYYVRRVAAAAVILLAGYGLVRIALDLKSDTAEDESFAETEIREKNPSTELGETMLYYVSQVNSKRQELEKKAEQYPEIANEIKVEFNELDAEFKNLENDLKENVSNAEVLEAMIHTARIKLEILEDMQQELKKMDELENTHHEKNTEL